MKLGVYSSGLSHHAALRAVSETKKQDTKLYSNHYEGIIEWSWNLADLLGTVYSSLIPNFNLIASPFQKLLEMKVKRLCRNFKNEKKPQRHVLNHRCTQRRCLRKTAKKTISRSFYDPKLCRYVEQELLFQKIYKTKIWQGRPISLIFGLHGKSASATFCWFEDARSQIQLPINNHLSFVWNTKTHILVNV